MLERILEQKVKPNLNNYSYFVYLWTNLETEAWYCGYHKGEAFDGYWHSGQNKELQKDFSNPNCYWRYEIIGWYKTASDAKTAEGDYIRKQKTRSDKVSYNIHNSQKPVVNLDLAPTMFRRISNGEYDVKYGSKKELQNLDGYQVRYIDHPEHVRDIADAIDENGGSIEKTDPLVIATGVKDVFGSDKIRIGGRHTKQGILKSKHATEYKYLEVDLEGWTKLEINQLGLLLNPEEEIKRKSNVDEDYEKHLLQLYEDTGKEAYSYEANRMLVEFGLNTRTRNRIANKVQKQIEQIVYDKKTGKTWKKWSAASNEAADLMSQYRTSSEVAVVMMSSAKFSLDRIAITLSGSNYSKVVVIMHHPNASQKKKWQSEIQPEKIKIMSEFIEAAGYDWEIVEAPTHKSDNN